MTNASRVEHHRDGDRRHFALGLWPERALLVVNLAVSGWVVWALLHAPRHTPPEGTAPWAVSLTNAYLLEVLGLGALATLAAFAQRQGIAWLQVLWACLGALVGLCVLSAWSIGNAFVPSVVLVLAASSLATSRTGAAGRQIIPALLAGFVFQIVLMVSIVVLVIRSAPPSGS